ncbi:MAG: hypothetical protein Q8Q11_03725 [bacterium]|nr:hypothetical protein [bacterium]MDZ4248110.1 hypothetical protein [Patescibacteria group bacterium]
MNDMDRHMDDTLLRVTMEEARAEVRRGQEATEVPVLHQADLDEALAGPQGERLERARAIAAGEPVDPPHRIREASRTSVDDEFRGMGPGVDYSSEARNF